MSKFDLDPAFVRQLAELLKDTGLSEIEYAEGDKRIRVAAQTSAIQVAAPIAHAPVGVASVASTAEVVAPSAASGKPITSPMVGTVYLAPEPGKPNFVKAGDRVKVGDTLLIIEAMKVMNPIKATQAGVIGEISVEDASPVEFGETLLTII